MLQKLFNINAAYLDLAEKFKSKSLAYLVSHLNLTQNISLIYCSSRLEILKYFYDLIYIIKFSLKMIKSNFKSALCIVMD